MRVALCIPNLLSYHTFLRELARGLAQRGDEVVIFTDLDLLFGSGEYQIDSFCEFQHVPFPRGANAIKHFAAAGRLARVVKDFAPDVLHVHFSATAFTAAVARQSFSCPVIATIQGLITPLSAWPKRLLMRLAETFAYRRMDSVWVLTPDDYRVLQRSVGTRKARLQGALGFGCCLDRFDSGRFTSDRVNELKLRSNIGPDHVTFSFVGRRTHFKGFHLVVRAFFKLLDQGFPGKLLLMGAYDKQHCTGLTRSEETRLAGSNDVIDLGWVREAESGLIMSDINVFPSQREGMPVNLMEALAMGVPVITIDSRGCRDVVRHEKDGIVLPLADQDLLFSAMLSLGSDASLRAKFRQNALSDRNRFDRMHWIREQLAIYDELCARPAQVLT